MYEDDYCEDCGELAEDCTCDNCPDCGEHWLDCTCDEDYEEEDEYTNDSAKYPHIRVQLVGQDGNAFSIMGRVTGAMRQAGVSKDEIENFRSEAMSGDYNNLLQTCMRWVTCN